MMRSRMPPPPKNNAIHRRTITVLQKYHFTFVLNLTLFIHLSLLYFRVEEITDLVSLYTQLLAVDHNIRIRQMALPGHDP